MFNNSANHSGNHSDSNSTNHSASLNSATTEQTALMEKILQEPLLLRRLCEQVYRLLLEDAQLQRDRFPRY